MLTKEVRADSSKGPPLSAETPVRYFRCCGSKPSWSPAEPFGNVWMASATVSSEIVCGWLCSSGDEIKLSEFSGAWVLLP